jgi:hypothetical protein
MLTGCQKQLDPREYGQVVNQVPTVEGADKPFPLPQLDEPEKPQETEKSP